MNNKGFAITTILYGTLILFLFLLLSMLGILNTYRSNLEKLEDENNGARETVMAVGNYMITDDNSQVYYRNTLQDAYSVLTVGLVNSEDEGEIVSSGTNKGTIKVLKNVTDSSSFNIESDKEITLDTNGKTITRKSSAINNAGKLTIKGTGAITMSEKKEVIDNNGDLTINNTTLTNSGGTNVILSKGTTKINSAKLKSTGWNAISQYGGNLVVTGENATISSDSRRAIYATEGANITIENGTIESKAALNLTSDSRTTCSSIHAEQVGAITIKNGTLISDHCNGIEQYNGSLIVEGGNIKSPERRAIYVTNKTNAEISGGLIEANGNVSTIDSRSGSSNITISGGTVKSTKYAAVITNGTLVVSNNARLESNGGSVYTVDYHTDNTARKYYIQGGTIISHSKGAIRTDKELHISGGTIITIKNENGAYCITYNGSDTLDITTNDSNLVIASDTGSSLIEARNAYVVRINNYITDRTVELYSKQCTILGKRFWSNYQANSDTNKAGRIDIYNEYATRTQPFCLSQNKALYLYEETYIHSRATSATDLIYTESYGTNGNPSYWSLKSDTGSVKIPETETMINYKSLVESSAK